MSSVTIILFYSTINGKNFISRTVTSPENSLRKFRAHGWKLIVP